jgi:hypothetical protein
MVRAFGNDAKEREFMSPGIATSLNIHVPFS